MKKFLLSLSALTLSLTAISGVNVSAQEIINEDYRNEIIENFIGDGLEKSKIQNLMEKIDAGEILDSMNPEEKPILTEVTFDLYGNRTETLTYEDDSYSITSVIAPLSIMPLNLGGNVSGGTSGSGSGYQNIKGATVYHSLGIFKVSYNADYTFVTGGNSYISNVYNESFNMPVDKVELGVLKKYQSGTTPALAQLQFKYNHIFYNFKLMILGYSATANLEYL